MTRSGHLSTGLGMMMDYSNLQVLAEVSVALLGFSGLTIVMGHSGFDQHGLAYRTQAMLYSSSLAFIGSLLPLVGISNIFWCNRHGCFDVDGQCLGDNEDIRLVCCHR